MVKAPEENRKGADWALIQAPQLQQGIWDCGWIALYNTFNFFHRSTSASRA